MTAQPDDSGWPSPALAWWTIAVFFVVALVSYSDRLVLSLLVDPIRADLQLGDTQVALVQGLAFALIYSVAGLPFGRLADLFPRRMVIIAGVIVWSLCTAASGYAHSFGALFAARVGVGIGEAAFAPAAVSMIADLFPPHRRGIAIGCLLTGMAAGSGAAIVIGGSLLEFANAGQFGGIPVLGALAPWRGVLVTLGLAGIVPLVLLLTLREPRRRETDRSGAMLSVAATLTEFRLRAAILVPLYLAVSLISAGDFAIQNWMPALLTRKFDYSPGDVAGSLGIVSILLGCAGTIAGGLLSDRVGRLRGDRGRLKVALWAAGLGFFGGAVAFAGSGDQAITFFALWIFMSSISGTVGITVLQNVIPNRMRGVGTAMVSFCNVLMGLAAGTALTGALTDYVFRDSLAVGFSMTGVAMTAGAIAFLLLRRTRNCLPRMSDRVESPAIHRRGRRGTQ